MVYVCIYLYVCYVLQLLYRNSIYDLYNYVYIIRLQCGHVTYSFMSFIDILHLRQREENIHLQILLIWYT